MALPDLLFRLGIRNRTEGHLLVLASPSNLCNPGNHILDSCLTHSVISNHLIRYIRNSDLTKNFKKMRERRMTIVAIPQMGTWFLRLLLHHSSIIGRKQPEDKVNISSGTMYLCPIYHTATSVLLHTEFNKLKLLRCISFSLSI